VRRYATRVTPFYKFPHIEGLKQAVVFARRHGLAQPTPYVGTVKLHGTNAAVVWRGDRLSAQSRNRAITADADNLGFAAWVDTEGAADLVFALADARAALPPEEDLIAFGEWVGLGIQRGVGVAALPRHFVVFALASAGPDGAHVFRDLPITPSGDVRAVEEVGVWSLTIDLGADLAPAVDQVAGWVAAVEARCPWAARRGVEGVGEGLVFRPADASAPTELWWKAKGEAHRGGRALAGGDVPGAPVDAEALAPAWRLEQGLAVLAEGGAPLTIQRTGEYVQWVVGDALREEAGAIAAAGWAERAVRGAVGHRAAAYYKASLAQA